MPLTYYVHRLDLLIIATADLRLFSYHIWKADLEILFIFSPDMIFQFLRPWICFLTEVSFIVEEIKRRFRFFHLRFGIEFLREESLSRRFKFTYF